MPAKTGEHRELTSLTLRSKAYWGYTGAQLESWREMLTITGDYILRHNVIVARISGSVIGYYSWIKTSAASVELDNMFLAPEYIGYGLGKILMQDFLGRMHSLGTRRIVLYSDPHAEAFYRKFGFAVTGETESNIKGRFLPVMTKEMP